MTSPKVIWSPLPGSQTRFLSCPFREVLLEGNRGGGKTDALLMDFAQMTGRGFGEDWRGIIFRQTYPQIKDIEAKANKWFRRIFPSAKYNKTEHFWQWSTGEVLYFRYGQTADDYWNYHGHAYPFLAFEELTNWATPDFYDAMRSTCRSTNPDMPRWIRATTNPFGKGHSWVKDWWKIGQIKPETPWGEKGMERLYIHSRLQENKILLEADPFYLKQLEDLKEPARRAAWLDGSWDINVGTFLAKVWDERTCVVDPFPIPATWKVWKSMDWGYSKPYAIYWFAMNEDGIVYVWRELYGIDHDIPNEGSREDAKEVAKKIKEIERLDERHGYQYRMNLADPAIFSKTGTENSIGSIFWQMGVRWQPAWNGKGSRIVGAQVIVQMLAEGRLKFFRTCVNAIRTLPTLAPSDYNPEDVDTDMEDHAWDSIRYGVMRRRRAPNKDMPSNFNPQSDAVVGDGFIEF